MCAHVKGDSDDLLGSTSDHVMHKDKRTKERNWTDRDNWSANEIRGKGMQRAAKVRQHSHPKCEVRAKGGVHSQSTSVPRSMSCPFQWQTSALESHVGYVVVSQQTNHSDTPVARKGQVTMRVGAGPWSARDGNSWREVGRR